MSFLKGSVTGSRFQVKGGELGEEGADLSAAVAKLAEHSFHRPVVLGQGEDKYPQFGWCGGGHLNDDGFAEEKVVRGPFLSFAVLVTRQKIPADEVQARAAQELEAAALGRPIRPQDRRDAVRIARDAMAAEAEGTGRYLVRKMTPVVYDSERRHLWLHTSSHAVADGVAALWNVTFGGELAPIDLAHYLGDGSAPSGAIPEWLSEAEAPNGWGNLFAREVVRTAADETIPLDRSFDWPSEDAVVKLIPRRTLTMRCPLGVKGLDRFDHELPYKVPELADALREGKLPTTLGLDLVSPGSDGPVPFALTPHRLAVSGARLPKGAAKGREEAQLERLEAVRSFFDTIDGAAISYARKHLD